MEPDEPILDPLVALAHLAAHTERILLGTGVIILPQRNPVVLAKQVASLDVLSGGRLILGIGVGYLEPEMTAIGVPMAGRGDARGRVPRRHAQPVGGRRARLPRDASSTSRAWTRTRVRCSARCRW